MDLRPARFPALFLSLLAGIATASPAGAEVAVGLKFGTLGAGPEVTLGSGGSLNGRISLTAFSVDADVETDRVDYDGELDLLNGAALVDWHPGGGSFRLSAGVVFNENEVVVEAGLLEVLSGEVLGGIPLPLPELGVVRGAVGYDSLGPYVGLGWGNALRGSSSWTFSFDLGVVWTGDPEADLDLVTFLPIEQIPEIAFLIDQILEAEERELEAELDGLTVYPVVSFTLSYRF